MADPDSLDKDHVFPRSKVTQAAARRGGLGADGIFHRIQHRSEELPNLCLLDGTENKGLKGSKTPADWLDSVAAQRSPGARSRLVRELDLQYRAQSHRRGRAVLDQSASRECEDNLEGLLS